MSAPGLMLLAAAAHLAPEHLARLLRHSQAAWESALFGLEAAVLWMALGGATLATSTALQPVAAYGAMEGLQRAACRVAWPMDRPPPRMRPGENLCDRATGLPASWFSLMCASIVTLQLAQRTRP